jgi:hypothetical protein
MSPMRSAYIELGLEIVSLEDIHSCTPKQPPMEEEKREKWAEDPFKFFLEESLAQKRNKMMDNFSQMLR